MQEAASQDRAWNSIGDVGGGSEVEVPANGNFEIKVSMEKNTKQSEQKYHTTFIHLAKAFAVKLHMKQTKMEEEDAGGRGARCISQASHMKVKKGYSGHGGLYANRCSSRGLKSSKGQLDGFVDKDKEQP